MFNFGEKCLENRKEFSLWNKNVLYVRYDLWLIFDGY